MGKIDPVNPSASVNIIILTWFLLSGPSDVLDTKVMIIVVVVVVVMIVMLLYHHNCMCRTSLLMSIISHHLLYRENAWLPLLWWQHSLGPQDGSPSGLQVTTISDLLHLDLLAVSQFTGGPTVYGLICRALDQSIFSDQQVQSWTGCIQVPEPDNLLPALGKMRPLIQQRQGNNSSTKKQICKGGGGHDKDKHDWTNPLVDVVLQLPPCALI